MNYRKNIDGLRAMAIIPVLLYHAGFGFCTGGFLGVDIFFVISGFLITTLIRSELALGIFSLKNFYLRRVRRILPALNLCVALTLIAALVLMIPSQLKELGESIVAIVLFAGNFFFLLKTDYWAQSSEVTPLIHMWSLGVEEQFYLIFPCLLLLLHRTKKTPWFLLLLLNLSFLGMLYQWNLGETEKVFYLLPFRAWELLLGATATFVPKRLSPTSTNVVSSLCFLLIVGSVVFLEKNTHPLLLFLPTTVATAVILILDPATGFVNSVLSNSIGVFIGKISYSLYLFHQPCLALFRTSTVGPLSNLQLVYCALMVLLISYFSYRCVETPFRKPGLLSTHIVVQSMAGLTVIFLLVGFYLYRTNGIRDYKLRHLSPQGRELIEKLEATGIEREKQLSQYLPQARSTFLEDGRKKILLVGDSLSQDLLVSFVMSPVITKNYQLRQIALDDECIKHISTQGNEIGISGTPCTQELKDFLKSTQLSQSDIIVLAQNWLSNTKYIVNFLTLPQLAEKTILIYKTHAFAEIRSFIHYIDKTRINPLSHEFKRFAFSHQHQRTVVANRELQNIASRRRFSTLQGFDCFCDDEAKECSIIDEHGFPLLMDQAHLSGAGFEKFSKCLSEQLQKLLGH